MKYDFKKITHCNMCGHSATHHKVIGKRMNCSQGRNPRKKIGITVSVQRCSVCGLIYSNPQPIPENISDHYGIPSDSYWSESYFNYDPAYFSAEIQQLKVYKPYSNGQNALDIGAGIGKGMISLKNAGYQVFGIEPSEPFYQKAIEKMNIDPQAIWLSSIEAAVFDTNFFDFITFGAVLEHLYDPDFCIKKALTWLKPQGIMHFEIPSASWLMAKIYNAYFRLMGTDYVTHLSPMHPPFHLYEFTKKSFIYNAAKNNYQLLACYYHPCNSYLPGILNKIMQQIMRWTNTGMQLTIWIRKN